MKYSQTLIDDEYESSNLTSQIELKVFVVKSHYIAIPIYQLLNKLWTSLSLTQKFKEYNRNNR